MLVSIGGVQSNHSRMVAATAAKIGMKCRLVQESWVPHDDAVYDRVGNIPLTRLMGADSRLLDEGFDIDIRQSWEDAMEDVRREGRGVPYGIPAGASVHKYSCLGYVGFAEEVGTLIAFACATAPSIRILASAISKRVTEIMTCPSFAPHLQCRSARLHDHRPSFERRIIHLTGFRRDPCARPSRGWHGH